MQGDDGPLDAREDADAEGGDKLPLAIFTQVGTLSFHDGHVIMLSYPRFGMRRFFCQHGCSTTAAK